MHAYYYPGGNFSVNLLPIQADFVTERVIVCISLPCGCMFMAGVFFEVQANKL